MATNEKFQHLLEGAVNATLDKKLKEPKRAPRKRIIERLRLYGVGFGGRLPTISKRKKKRNEPDPDVVALLKVGCTLGRCASTYCTQPPEVGPSASGELRYEHEALYKAFTHGHLSAANPERMFYSAANGNADCSGGNRPRWYYGSQDPGWPVDGARYLQTAKRYGYRGSSAMRDHHPPRSADSFRSVRESTPLFLRQHKTIVDEWTPMITAAPPKMGMPLLSSPKLWPDNAMYVEGYKHKIKSQSALYNKETTINSALKGPDLKVIKVVGLEEEERAALHGATGVERRYLSACQTDERGLRTEDAVDKVEDEMAFSPRLMTVRSTSRSHSPGRRRRTRRTPNGAATRNQDGDFEDPSDDPSLSSSRVLESGQSGSQEVSAPHKHTEGEHKKCNAQSAWARGSRYWPPGKKGHKTDKAPVKDKESKRGKEKGRGKGKGKGGRHEHEMSSAAHDYQERRKGARMQLSRSETILIRHRPTRTHDGAVQPSDPPLDSRLGSCTPPRHRNDRSGPIRHHRGGGGRSTENRRRDVAFVQYHLKWHAVRHLYDVILNSRLPGRPGTSLNLVGTLCLHLQTNATANEAHSMIDRESFIHALLGKYGSLILDSKANLIFSTFDPFNLNRIHYVHLIACLSILEHPSDTAKRKLLNLWRLYKEHRKDRNVLDNLLSILTTCCSNSAEHATMERAVRGHLIPYCYRAMALKPSAHTKTQLDAFKQAGPVLKTGNAKKAAVAQAREEEAEAAKKRAAAAEAAAAGQGGSKATANRGAAPNSTETDVVYNICNEALDENDFGEALAACPQVLDIFEEQMKAICYQQNRRTMEEAERERAREEAARKKFEQGSESNGQLGASTRKWMGEEREGEGEGQGEEDEEEEGEEEEGGDW